MSASRDFLTQNALEALRRLVNQGKNELTTQGHVQTGTTRDNIIGDWVWPEGSDKATATVFTDEVGMILDNGIAAANVPFSAPSGRGGTSEYLEGLMASVEFRQPGLSEAEYLGIAIAIATVATRVGHPTSNAEEKTNWIQKGLVNNEEQFIASLQLEQYLIFVVDDFLLALDKLPNVETTI